MDPLEERLRGILRRYSESFSGKQYKIESDESDVLMEVFGITQELKKENKQYWGRELGMCWQLLVVEVFKTFCKDFAPAKRYGEDEPADFFVINDAVDTKYRVGSGDSGTLKKFKQYGELLRNDGYTPVFLFLRTDNLPAAMTACKSGGWTIYEAGDSFKYIQSKTNFDLKSWLVNHKIGGNYTIIR